MNTLEAHFDQKAKSYSCWWHRLGIKQYERKYFFKMLPSSLLGQNVLEVACGTGYYTEELSNRKPQSLDVLDISRQMIENVSVAGVSKIHEDFLNFQTSKRYDLIVCAGGLEFMSDRAFFFRAQTVASSKAEMLLLTPVGGFMGRFYKNLYKRSQVNVRLYDEQSLQESALSANWSMSYYRKIHPFAGISFYQYEG